MSQLINDDEEKNIGKCCFLPWWGAACSPSFILHMYYVTKARMVMKLRVMISDEALSAGESACTFVVLIHDQLV